MKLQNDIENKVFRDLHVLILKNKPRFNVSIPGSKLVLKDSVGASIYDEPLENYLSGRASTRLFEFVDAGFGKYVVDILVNPSSRLAKSADVDEVWWTERSYQVMATGRYIRSSSANEYMLIFGLKKGNLELCNDWRPPTFAQFPSATEIRDSFRHWLDDATELLALMEYLNSDSAAQSKAPNISPFLEDGRFQIKTIIVDCKQGKFRYYSALDKVTYLRDVKDVKRIVEEFRSNRRPPLLQVKENDAQAYQLPLETDLNLV